MLIENGMVVGEWHNGLLHGIIAMYIIDNEGGVVNSIGIWDKGIPTKNIRHFEVDKDGTVTMLNYDFEELPTVTMIQDDGVYIGGASGNLPDGWGVQIWDKGDRYIGQWQNGKFHGIGLYEWSNGEIFIGKFENHNTTQNGAWFDENSTLIQSP